MTDKPKVHLSIAALDAEIGVVEPFTLALKDSKTVTFPDFGSMEAEEGERFLSDLENAGKRDTWALKKWLSPKEYEKFAAAKLTLRARSIVLQRVTTYYQSTLGDPGEDGASAR